MSLRLANKTRYYEVYWVYLLAFLMTLTPGKLQGQGQDDLVEGFTFGKVAQADLEMTQYESDTSASAVVLSDEGLMSYDFSSRNYVIKYHVLIKILEKDAFDWADLELSYKGKKGLVRFAGATHNLVDGEMISTRVGKDQIKREEVVDKLYTTKVSFPNVKVGSVIEYQYEILAKNLFQYLPWYFQKSIPVRDASFYMDIPGAAERLVARVFGYVPVKTYEKGRSGNTHFIIMENIPAFKDEAYVKNPDDHYSKIEFDYVSDKASNWEELKKLISEMRGFGKMMERLKKLDEVYPAGKRWANTEKDLKDIHRYVVNHFTWDGTYGLIFNDKPKNLWESTQASASDINLFLLMFLRKAGFEAEPVFLSTISHGLIEKELPSIRQFNYVVVKAMVNDKTVLIDATSKLRPYNVLPSYCLNDSALVMKPGPVEWVPMNINGERAVHSYSVQLEINDDYELRGNGTARYSDAAAATIRTKLNELDQDEMEKRFPSQNPDMVIEELSYEGMEDPYEAIKARYKFDMESKVDVIGDKLFLSPLVIKEVEKNPFKAESRDFPVEFTMPLNKRYFFNLKIPEGYQVESLPETVKLVLPNGGGSYHYICQQAGNMVQVMVRFNINKLMFYQPEYPHFREMFNLIIAKQDEKIVLKEK